jgi:23S rRNA pseudouridine2605 synthase
MHPRYEVPRTYWLAVHGADPAAIRVALSRPIVIDGRAVRVVESRVRPLKKSVEIELTIAEGRQRIVRRIAEALDLKVEWLHRVAYGPVRLGKLAEGQWRELTRQEIGAIERLHGAG